MNRNPVDKLRFRKSKLTIKQEGEQWVLMGKEYDDDKGCFIRVRIEEFKTLKDAMDYKIFIAHS